MPQHHHGLIVTDITVAHCSSLNPFASCKLDPAVWHRVDKDLYLGKAWTSHAYLHVSRKKEEELLPDDKIVLDVSVGRLDPTTSGHKGEQDEVWERRPAGLWVKRTSNQKLGDSSDVVTGADILFGDDAVDARSGWSVVGTQLLLSAKESTQAAFLTVRRGSEQDPKKPQPRIPDNGKFKIMQVADLHLSTGVGLCRDAVPDSYNGGACEADPRTLDFVIKIVDEEKPNMVVLTGDQVNGETAPDAQSVCSLKSLYYFSTC